MIASEKACSSSAGILSWTGVLLYYSTLTALPIKRIFCANSAEIYGLGSILCLSVNKVSHSSSSSSTELSAVSAKIEPIAFKFEI